MTRKKTYDLTVIGAGPGGYTGAIRASQLGLKVCLIEKEKPGGICLNWGCIPTKSLIHQAEVFQSGSVLKEMGVGLDMEGFDYGLVVKKSRASVDRLVRGIEYLLKNNRIDLVAGTGRIVSEGAVAIDEGEVIRSRHILIATGSRPLQLPGFETDENRVLSSTGILSQRKLPESLVVLGGGAIGCEFAYIMNAFGVKVHLVELMDRLLPHEDHETTVVLEKSLQDRGVELLTGTMAVSVEKMKKSVRTTVRLPDGKERLIESSHILCVFGRNPNTEGLGLENTGIETEKEYIVVGDYYRASAPGVYAIGDVVATPLLAHVASKEAEIAVEHMAGHKTTPRMDLRTIPSVIFCSPQIGGFGLREMEAVERGIPYKTTTFPYQAMGKAVAVDQARGLIKILTDPNTTEILGAHIVGHNAAELIHEILLAKCHELIPEDIGQMVHAHPTLSEGIMEGMRAVEGRAIHI